MNRNYSLLETILHLAFVITVGNWATTSETVGSGPKPEQEEKTRKEEPKSNLGNVTPTKMPCSSLTANSGKEEGALRAKASLQFGKCL